MTAAHEIHATSGFTPEEELANSVTHVLGTVFSVVATAVLVVMAIRAGDPYLVFACSLYGATLVALHLASTTYHSARDLKWKRRFLVLDHSCIYLLIAGTYTPFLLGPLRGGLGWAFFGIIWSLAAAGLLREALRVKRGGVMPSLIYLGMGWLCLGILSPLYHALSSLGFGMLLAGGVVYSLGVIFYLWRRIKYNHAIWHMFVMAGAACHWVAVWTLVR